MRRHAFIAGTGRAGTTFLVRFLHACGVEAGDLGAQLYFPEADAGYEWHPLDEQAPYLVKNPRLGDFVDRIDLDAISVEALVVPIRDLREAAASRVLRERAHLAVHSPNDPDLEYETHGRVPGGVIYGLSIVDQQRMVAVELARLLAWAVSNDLPLYLLDFPRLVDDAEYVVDKLWPWLSGFTDRGSAIAAHRSCAEPERVELRHPETDDDLTLEELRIENQALRRAVRQLKAQADRPIDQMTFEVGTEMRLEAILRQLDRLIKQHGTPGDEPHP